MSIQNIVLTIAIVVLSASRALALSVTAQLSVSGNLGLAATTAGCINHTYTAVCPAMDNCSCYKLSKASLHSTSIAGVSIPPGKTTAFFAVDGKDGTGSAGTCKPMYGQIDYAADSGPDAVEIFLFGTLCSPLAAGAPLSVSGGGAIEQATIQINQFITISPTGYGTATGAYSPGAQSQSFTLNLAAIVSGP